MIIFRIEGSEETGADTAHGVDETVSDRESVHTLSMRLSV